MPGHHHRRIEEGVVNSLIDVQSEFSFIRY